MIDEVLERSSVRSGTLGLRQDEIVVGDVVSAALKLVGASAELADVSLDCRVDPHLPALLADRRMVDQMLLDLLSNAIKLTPSGGRVVLRASLGERGLELVVENSGPGIESSDMDLAFMPVGPALRPPSGCTGIGLGFAIARTLVEL